MSMSLSLLLPSLSLPSSLLPGPVVTIVLAMVCCGDGGVTKNVLIHTNLRKFFLLYFAEATFLLIISLH
jgi:hypothetical protein